MQAPQARWDEHISDPHCSRPPEPGARQSPIPYPFSFAASLRRNRPNSDLVTRCKRVRRIHNHLLIRIQSRNNFYLVTEVAPLRIRTKCPRPFRTTAMRCPSERNSSVFTGNVTAFTFEGNFRCTET